MTLRRGLLALILAPVLAAAGARAPWAADVRTVDLVLVDGRVSGEGVSRPPRGAGTLRLRQGEDVAIGWTVDRATDLHLHGYGVEVRATPGDPATMRFTARAAGRFPVEVHDARGRHGTVLYLEVHPR